MQRLTVKVQIFHAYYFNNIYLLALHYLKKSFKNNLIRNKYESKWTKPHKTWDGKEFFKEKWATDISYDKNLINS